jgi:hypothetical protein
MRQSPAATVVARTLTRSWSSVGVGFGTLAPQWLPRPYTTLAESAVKDIADAPRRHPVFAIPTFVSHVWA